MPIRTPTHLGRYEILDEIGRGAMGVVYMAKDPLIGRLVALKTFRATEALQGRDLEMFRARFIREAQSAGILSHPNIVTIHDVVEESEEGVTFIAMEYVRGTNLKDVLRSETRLSIEEAAHVVAEVAEGLEYAHSRGVVHRDVKPANILLTEDRRVKLTDFGIARFGTSNLTHDGQLLGTPNYMAPEQIRGEAADHRADVFSLGVVLYEMLTGEKPFQGENVTVVTHRIAYEDFIPPDRHGPGLPAAVERVLERALAKDPDERFPSVAEMAQALAGALKELRNQELLNETQEIVLELAPEDASLESEAGDQGPVAESEAAAVEGSSEAARAPRGAPGADLAAALGRALSVAGRGARRAAELIVPDSLERPPVLRLLVVAVVTAALSTGIAWGVWFLVRPEASGPDWAVQSPIHDQRVQALPVLRQATDALEAGESHVAVDLLRAAETLAPDVEAIGEIRRRVEQSMESAELAEARAEEVSEALAQAHEAARVGHWNEARTAAEAALAVDEANEEAQTLLADADQALERLAREREARRAASAAEPVAEQQADEVAEAVETPARVESVPAPGAIGKATLALSFYSSYPEGVLTIYLDESQLVREPYRFYRRGRFLRLEGTGGMIENSYEIPSGSATLRVILALPDRPALTRSLDANFPDGTTRRLEIRLEEDEELVARLE